MIFIQRDGNVGDVPFTGDQARVLGPGGQVVVDWTSGGVVPDVPQGSGYTLEVRTGSAVVSDSLAVGAVAFTLGQSNIQRWFDGPTAVPSASDTYAMEVDGDIVPVSGGAARHFTAAYAAEAGVPVLIVDAAKGGTALVPEADKGNGHWLDTSSGSLYAMALSLLEKVGGSAEFVLWAQGETDASDNVTTARYASALTDFMNRVLADFDPTKVLIQQIGPHGGDNKYDQVRVAQGQVADALAGVDIGAVATDLETIEDGIHLSGAARALAADRMAEAALDLIGAGDPRPVQTGSNLTGGGGDDELRGTGGADALSGGGGSDVVLGGDGNDALQGGPGVDFITGNAGNDTIDGGDDTDVLSGGAGLDSISGGGGNDDIWGDAGDDQITGGPGNDVVFGGAGTDTATYSGARAGYSVSTSGSTVNVSDLQPSDGNDGSDSLNSIEALQFSDGTVDPNGPGLPPLFTTGIDYADFATIASGTYAPASYYAALAGNDEVYLPPDAAAAAAAGYSASNTFDAGPGNDVVIGGGLNDRIKGGDGNDILNGGGGTDTLEGGLGDDVYYADASTDTLFERVGEGFDTAYSSAPSLTMKSNIENLVLDGPAAVSGTGNAENNTMTGNALGNKLSGREGNDTLIGGDGNDTLDGGAGTDSMEGGAGDDTYTVDSTGDLAVEAADGGYDAINSPASYTLGANMERLTLQGTGDIDGTGNAQANRLDGNGGKNALNGAEGADNLFGLAGDDTLTGGAGADTLEGGLGADALAGGAENDRFVFRTAAEIGGGDTGLPSDTITDFARGDRIDVSRLDANTATAADEGFAFIGTAAFTASGQLRYEQDAAAARTAIQGNLDADAAADFQLYVGGVQTPSSSDFAL